MTYEPLNDIQVSEINSQVRRYLEGTIDELDVSCLSEIWELIQRWVLKDDGVGVTQ